MASDFCIQAWLLSFGTRLHVLVDRTGYPLQYDVFGRGLRTSSSKVAVDLRLGFLRRVVMAIIACHKPWRRICEAAPALHALPALPAPEIIAGGVWSLRRILLTSGRLAGRTNLLLIEEDLFSDPVPEVRHRFHAVRAANILSPSYFSDAELRRMIANLRSRLKPDGLLIVCHTEDDSVNNATLFRLAADGGFKVVGELGIGAIVMDLVLEDER